MTADGGTRGEGRRRSGRRSAEPLQHILVGGGPPAAEDDLAPADAKIPDEPGGPDDVEVHDDLEPDDVVRDGTPDEATDAGAEGSDPTLRPPAGTASEGSGGASAERTGARTRPPGRRPTADRAGTGPRRQGLDRIPPRTTSATAAGDAGEREPAEDLGAPADRDPLGRAALYSTGTPRSEPALGTFLVECSACRRETPVTTGDLVRLGLPSFHLPFVKRFPSLMRCPACGRRTWLRVHWRF